MDGLKEDRYSEAAGGIEQIGWLVKLMLQQGAPKGMEWVVSCQRKVSARHVDGHPLERKMCKWDHDAYVTPLCGFI